MADQEILLPSVARHVDRLSEWFWSQWSSLTPISHPMFGANEGGVFEDILKGLRSRMESFFEFVADGKFLQFDVRAMYLRPMEKGLSVNELANMPHLHGKNFMDRVKSAQQK